MGIDPLPARLAALAVGAAACGHAPLAVPPATDPSFVPLALPAPARDLLGHEAAVAGDGDVTTRRQLRPGCIVRATEQELRYRVTGRRAHSGAAFLEAAAGPADVGVRVRGASQVEFEVENLRVVGATVEGDCGPQVVRRVFVGSGRVRFLREATAAAGVRAAGIAGAGAQESSSVLHEIEFADAGYAVEVAAGERGSDALRVDLDLSAERLADGEALEVRLYASRPAYAVLASISAGQAYLLLPSAVRPAARVGPEGPLVFPVEEERAAGLRLIARLPAGQKEAEETLVAWLFLDEPLMREVVPLRSLARAFTVEPAADLEARVARAAAAAAPGRVAQARRPYRIVQEVAP